MDRKWRMSTTVFGLYAKGPEDRTRHLGLPLEPVIGRLRHEMREPLHLQGSCLSGTYSLDTVEVLLYRAARLANQLYVMSSRLASSFSRFLPNPKSVATKSGVEKGPMHLIESGLPQQLTKIGWKVQFDGELEFEHILAEDDPPIGNLKNPRAVSRVCELVAKVVGDRAKKGQLPLTLGGDHSLAMGTISGILEYVTEL
ncbi:hypothetical protein NUW54_g8981 [Trametes sanguinea]|uniref:Uncharacterized protein n=1 Tax=Trametes sanguinea TaxID=158606 RepID=A0ACC1PCH4_9APHY|nr:hypothetical protein NUW54_g8981 [Trametes sanguinea]